MKKSNLLFAALAALTFFSCAKENNETDAASEDAKLTIKIANPTTVGSRGVENIGTAATATVDYPNSVVFVAATTGGVKKAITLDATAGAAGGQTIDKVPTSGQVFVLANVPAAQLAAAKALPTVKAIQDYVIKTAAAGTFPNVVLSNATGAGVAYTATGVEDATKTANVAVSISPAMSRLELPKIGLTAEATVKSYTVTGIYIDRVFESFTPKGDKGTGTQVDIKQDIANATIAYYKDENNTSSVSGIVVPGTDKAWAYQIPAGDTPNIIIRVNNVVMTDGSFFDGADGAKPYYITAKLDGTVVRASIYPMADGILFSEANLHPEPNPDLTGAEINVKITPVAWIIGSLSYDLD